MRKVMIFFAICVLATGIFAQNKDDDAQPQFSREPTGTELVKPIQTEPLPSSLTNSEMQAWDMIFRELEKNKSVGQIETKEPRTRLDKDSNNQRRGKGDHIKSSESKGERGTSAGKPGEGRNNRPSGWDKGEKEGWKGGDTPPGLRKQNRKRGRNEK